MLADNSQTRLAPAQNALVSRQSPRLLSPLVKNNIKIRQAWSPHKQQDVEGSPAEDAPTSSFFYSAGLKKKALEALTKCQTSASVHQATEIQRIASGSDRVEVKLEFIREHASISTDLQRIVEQAFMCPSGVPGENIVDVAKLRSKGRGYRESACKDLLRPISRSSAEQTRVLPASAGLAMRSKAFEHALRAEETVARGKFIDLNCRLSKLKRLQERQDRRAKSDQAKPWLAGVAAILATVVFKTIIETYKHAKNEAKVVVGYDVAKASQQGVYVLSARTGNVSINGRRPSLSAMNIDTRLLSPASYVSCNGEVREHQVLSNRQLERLCSQLHLLRRQETTKQVSDSVFAVWKRLLLVSRFVYCVKQIVRKNRCAETLKEFIVLSSQGPQGHQLQQALKQYTTSVRLVQRILRCQTHFLRLVRLRILLPEVWAVETLVLCKMLKVPEEVAYAKIQAHFNTCEVERYKEEVTYLRQRRYDIWHGKMPLTKPDTANAPLVSPSSPAAHRGSSVSSRQQARQTRSIKELSRITSPTSIHPAESSRSRRTLRKPQCKAVGYDSLPQLDAATTMVMERLRLDPELHTQIATNMMRDNLASWFNLYQSYRSSIVDSRQNWRAWRQQLVQMVDMGYSHDVRPDPPEVLHFPQTLDKIHVRRLREQVEALIQKRAADWLGNGGFGFGLAPKNVLSAVPPFC